LSSDIQERHVSLGEFFAHVSISSIERFLSGGILGLMSEEEIEEL
jgi:hypothetical protein